MFSSSLCRIERPAADNHTAIPNLQQVPQIAPSNRQAAYLVVLLSDTPSATVRNPHIELVVPASEAPALRFPLYTTRIILLQQCRLTSHLTRCGEWTSAVNDLHVKVESASLERALHVLVEKVWMPLLSPIQPLSVLSLSVTLCLKDPPLQSQGGSDAHE